MNKIQKIEIKQYRGLKNMTLEKLSRINVLVGENNSGKTSILEAIELMSKPFSSVWIFTVASQRRGLIDGSQIGEVLKWIFPQENNEHKPIELDLYGDNKKTSITLVFTEQEFVDFDLLKNSKGHFLNEENFATIAEQTIKVKVDGKEKDLEFKGQFPKGDKSDILYKSAYISSTAGHHRNISAERVGEIILTQQKDKLIEMLQQFDCDITGIEIVPIGKNDPLSDSNQIYLQKNNQELMPLSSFGEGLQKVTLIASVLLNRQGSVLLLDEAEVAIHTKMIPTFFEWLSKLAEQNNVTVFMTTHSLEAVDGVLYANKESLENLSFYRLEKNKVKRFSGERMYSIRYDFGMEVRG